MKLTLDIRPDLVAMMKAEVAAGERAVSAAMREAGAGLKLAWRGQIVGALCQGLGWMTIEEIRHADTGRLLTDTLTTYKVPDLLWMPRDLQVHFLDDAIPSPGPYQSKAIGEPPFLYGIGAFFALRDALRAFRPGRSPAFDAPMTPERALMFLADTGGA